MWNKVIRAQGLWPALLLVLLCVPLSFAQSKDQIAPTLTSAHRAFSVFAPRGHLSSGSPSGGAEFDSLQNFSGEFRAPGIGPSGSLQHQWFYTMAGGKPEAGVTTSFDAPIVPVSLDLLDYDGSVREVNGHKLHYSVEPFVGAVINSPVFQNAEYSSSDVPAQFADAVQRAEFYNVMRTDWHTVLRPSVKSERTVAVPRGAYFFALQDDGSCCAFVLLDINVFSKLLFPATPTDAVSPVGSAELTGDITPQSISTFLFPNTYLYLNGNPNHCCVLGFHTYDFEPGDTNNGLREKRYVLNYASWISPGLFGAGFEDITALSHEIVESLNDPFVGSDGVHGITPWWLSVNGNCQNDLEVGDVIEGLPDATVAISTRGKTYHPQNAALLQWFEFQSPSTAIGGAYSYPDQSVITSLSLPQRAKCR